MSKNKDQSVSFVTLEPNTHLAYLTKKSLRFAIFIFVGTRKHFSLAIEMWVQKTIKRKYISWLMIHCIIHTDWPCNLILYKFNLELFWGSYMIRQLIIMLCHFYLWYILQFVIHNKIRFTIWKISLLVHTI